MSHVDFSMEYQLRWTGKPVKAKEIYIDVEVVSVAEEDGFVKVVYKPRDNRIEGFYAATFLSSRAIDHARKQEKVGKVHHHLCLGTELDVVYPASTDTFEEGWYLWRRFGLGPKTDPKGTA